VQGPDRSSGQHPVLIGRWCTLVALAHMKLYVCRILLAVLPFRALLR
jgi:hypothetical protein